MDETTQSKEYEQGLELVLVSYDFCFTDAYFPRGNLYEVLDMRTCHTHLAALFNSQY